MAAAIIPILVAAEPLLRPLILSLIVHAEKLFGDKTGAIKFNNVLTAVVKTAEDLSTSGKIPGTLDPASLANMIESGVQELKNKKILTPEQAGAIVAANEPTNSLPAKTTIKITGGTIELG